MRKYFDLSDNKTLYIKTLECNENYDLKNMYSLVSEKVNR